MTFRKEFFNHLITIQGCDSRGNRPFQKYKLTKDIKRNNQMRYITVSIESHWENKKKDK